MFEHVPVPPCTVPQLGLDTLTNQLVCKFYRDGRVAHVSNTPHISVRRIAYVFAHLVAGFRLPCLAETLQEFCRWDPYFNEERIRV